MSHRDQERGLRWSEETRLRAIDAMVFWEGRINRADLIRRFGISVPQATNDLREYQARAPGNLRYDGSEKAYLATAGFQPLFGAPSAETWLSAAAADAAAPLPAETIPLPARRVDPWVLRRMLTARRARMALRVLYQPMDTPEPSWRWFSPTALGSDGLRWHLRGYNHDASRYEDLLFPRMLEVDGERPAQPQPPDHDWERFVTVRLRPAARLSPGQRRVIEADYGMEAGEARMDVPVALLSLFVRRMRLDREGGSVEIVNRAEVQGEIRRLDGLFVGAPGAA